MTGAASGSTSRRSTTPGRTPLEATLGFRDKANLDRGIMCPTVFALKSYRCGRCKDRRAREERSELTVTPSGSPRSSAAGSAGPPRATAQDRDEPATRFAR